jgi:hypothetical protein
MYVLPLLMTHIVPKCEKHQGTRLNKDNTEKEIKLVHICRNTNQ